MTASQRQLAPLLPTGTLCALAVGDRVTQWLAGVVPREMLIVSVTATEIGCTVPENATPDGRLDNDQLVWTFDRATGFEIDHELEWGPSYGASGSYLGQPQS